MSPLGVPAGRTARFAISSRSGVWQVTRNDAFYGDYLTREEAVDSACSAARSYEAGGGTALVLSGPRAAVIAHQQPNPKPQRAARARSAR